MFCVHTPGPHWLIRDEHCVYNTYTHQQLRMGKHSPQNKRAQRRRQKARRKLVFSRKSANSVHTDSPSPTTADSTHSTDLPSEICNNRSNTEDNNEELGVDLDVVQMEIENPYEEHFSTEYLLSCRRKLMLKVSAYRQEVERLRTHSAS